MTSKPSHYDAQVREFMTLKTNTTYITVAGFRGPESRADKVFQCIISRPYAKETLIQLLKQKRFRLNKER